MAGSSGTTTRQQFSCFGGRRALESAVLSIMGPLVSIMNCENLKAGLFVALAVLVAADVNGQSYSSGFGSGGFGGSGFGSSGFGSSGFGNSGFGQSGFGSSGFGSSGFGGSRFGGSSAFGGQGGRRRFVGRSGDDMRSLFDGIGRSQNQFLDNYFNRRRSERARRRRSRSTSIENQRPPVRTTLKVAFESPVTVSSDVASGATSRRLNALLVRRGESSARVEMVGRTAVLSGNVVRDDDRRFLERLISLEPGVSNVRNELAVVQSEEIPVPELQ